MPRFVIVIPCYNAAETIDDAIQSALAQTHDDFLVCVSDSASADGSAERIAEYSSPRLKISLFDETLPKTENWNRAYFEAPECEYLVTLHADDRLAPDCLQHIEEAAAYKPSMIHGAARSITYSGDHIPTLNFPFSHRANAKTFHEVMLLGNIVYVPGATVRQDIFAELNGWPLEWTVLQDVELWWRLATYGDVVYCRQRLGDYRQNKAEVPMEPMYREQLLWYFEKMEQIHGRRLEMAARAGFMNIVRLISNAGFDRGSSTGGEIEELLKRARNLLGKNRHPSQARVLGWQRRLRLTCSVRSIF